MTEPSNEDKWKVLAVRELLIGDEHSKRNAEFFLSRGTLYNTAPSKPDVWERWLEARERKARAK